MFVIFSPTEYCFLSGKGAFGNVYTCQKSVAGYKKKYAAKIVEFGEDNKIKWQTENEIEVIFDSSYFRHFSQTKVKEFPR